MFKKKFKAQLLVRDTKEYKYVKESDLFVLLRGNKVIQSGSVNYFRDIIWEESLSQGIKRKHIQEINLELNTDVEFFGSFFKKMVFDIDSKSYILGKYRLIFFEPNLSKIK